MIGIILRKETPELLLFIKSFFKIDAFTLRTLRYENILGLVEVARNCCLLTFNNGFRK